MFFDATISNLIFFSCRNNYLNLHNRVTQLKIGIVLLWYLAYNFLLMLYIQNNNNLRFRVWRYRTHALQEFQLKQMSFVVVLSNT